MHNTGSDSDAEGGEMQSSSPDLDRRAADQLLVGTRVDGDALSRLLQTARSTTGHADSAGLNVALANFTQHAQIAATVVSQPTRSLLRVAVARIIAAKVFVIATLVVLATGGIALAASTGKLPSPLPGSSHPSATATDSGATSSDGRVPLAPGQKSAPGSGPTTLGPSPTTDPSSSAADSASASPSLIGLCKSWLARPHSNGKADNSAGFSVLVTAAGGVDAVDGYCTTLLANAASSTAQSSPITSSATAEPTDPTAPSGKKTHSNGKVTGKDK